MRRRRFCALLGTVGVGATAGCTDRLPEFGPNTQFPPAARDADFDPMLDDSPAERVDVGSRVGVLRPADNGPHGLNVWNDGPTREITVSVFRNTFPAHEAFERTFELAAGEYVALTLHRPANYTSVVSVEDATDGSGGTNETNGTGGAGGTDATAASVGVDRSNFDCNESATTVAVRESGRMECSSWSTTMGCGPL
ncbi:hypothetical protein [Haloprofundus halobius]|uniref:hypothetical protein n=1 Tax=Haloprofundus halobius TaxID=2876194 RepID=UPI001CCA696C|nr:hypothetical protein [Haloprofundus halobius]